MSLEERVANMQCEEAAKQEAYERLIADDMVAEVENISLPDFQEGRWK